MVAKANQYSNLNKDGSSDIIVLKIGFRSLRLIFTPLGWARVHFDAQGDALINNEIQRLKKKLVKE